MIEYTCRRCGGRRTVADDNGKPCFVCLGKGRIVIKPETVKSIYRKEK